MNKMKFSFSEFGDREFYIVVCIATVVAIAVVIVMSYLPENVKRMEDFEMRVLQIQRESAVHFSLHNYKTGKDESVPFPTTDKEAMQYIPQDRETRNLYAILRASGRSIPEAMKDVYDVYTAGRDDK